MSKRRLALFNNHSGYTEFYNSDEMVRPNVSYCVEQNEVHYNEAEMVFTLNLNITGEIQTIDVNILVSQESEYKKIMVDGVTIDTSTLGWGYIDFTVGEHVVEYVFPEITTCPIILCDQLFGVMVSLEIPEGIERIETYDSSYYDGLPGIKLPSSPCTLNVPSTINYIDIGAICSDGTVTVSQDDTALLDSCCPGGAGWWFTRCTEK